MNENCKMQKFTDNLKKKIQTFADNCKKIQTFAHNANFTDKQICIGPYLQIHRMCACPGASVNENRYISMNIYSVLCKIVDKMQHM